MKTIKYYIRLCDYYSNEVKLMMNSNEDRVKNTFGGVISLLSFLIIIGTVMFFCVDFIKRENPIIISNTSLSKNNSITNVNSIPYLFRLTNDYQEPYEDARSVYEIIFSFFISEYDPINQSLKQKFTLMESEPCNIDKHFGEYRKYFLNTTDIHTYYCPKWTIFNQTLFGQYGDNSPYSFNNWFIRRCYNSTSNPVICKEEKVIKNILSRTYLDFRTVDNLVDNIGENPINTIVKGDRFPISNTLYKRIFMRYQNIKFNNDIGFVFKDVKKHEFFQFHSYKEEIDLRDYDAIKELPGAFVVFSTIQSDITIFYYREYMKLQNFLANVGGIIKGISAVGTIIMYFISDKYFYQELINQNSKLYDLYNDSICIQNTKLLEKIKDNSTIDNRNKENNLRFSTLNKENFKINVRKKSSDLKDEIKDTKESKSNNENEDYLNTERPFKSNIIKSKKSKSQVPILEETNNVNSNNKDYEFKNNDIELKTIDLDKFNQDPWYYDDGSRSNYILTKKMKLTIKRRNLKLNLKEILLPVFCLNSNLNKLRYEVGYYDINEQLNISNIINQLYQFSIFKKLILDDDQSHLFDYLFSNPLKVNKASNSVINSFQLLLNKDDYNIIDLKLIEQAKLRLLNYGI